MRDDEKFVPLNLPHHASPTGEGLISPIENNKQNTLFTLWLCLFKYVKIVQNSEGEMVRIVLRLLLILILVFNAVLLIISSLTGVNVYQKYGKQILIGVSIFAGMVIAFYVALALLGITD